MAKRCSKCGHLIERSKGYNNNPYGYARSNGKLVPVEEEQRWVRFMVEQYANGVSPRRIAAELDKRRVPTRLGGRWCYMSIARAIRRAQAAEAQPTA